MAIGEFGNSNYGQNNSSDNKKLFEYTYYSRLRFRNNNSEDDRSINVSFNSGLLKFVIQKKNGYKFDDLSDMYFSPMKAREMADQIDAFLEYFNAGKIDEQKAFGVYGGMGEKTRFIGIKADKNKNIYIGIGKIDNDGNVIEYNEFDFAKNYHFIANWNNISKNDVDLKMDDMLEVYVMRDLLRDFGRAMSGAYAYATLDTARWDYARMMNKMNPIYDKLGIERTSGNKGGYGTNNFLANLGKGGSYSNSSIDEIEDVFSEEE